MRCNTHISFYQKSFEVFARLRMPWESKDSYKGGRGEAFNNHLGSVLEDVRCDGKTYIFDPKELPLNITARSVHEVQMPSVLKSLAISSENTMQIRGLRVNSTCSVSMSIDFINARINITDISGEIMYSFPDDALTNVGFWQDSTGDVHFARWNPFGRGMASQHYSSLVSEAMKKDLKGMCDRNLLQREGLKKSRPSVSLVTECDALRGWLSQVFNLRRQIYEVEISKILGLCQC